MLALLGDLAADTGSEAPMKRIVNWGRFYSKLKSNIRSLPITKDKEDINRILEEEIHRTIDEYNPLNTQMKQNKYGEIRNTIQELITEMKRKRRRTQRTSNLEDKRAVNALSRDRQVSHRTLCRRFSYRNPVHQI